MDDSHSVFPHPHTDLRQLSCLPWSCLSHNDNHIIVSNHIQKLKVKKEIYINKKISLNIKIYGKLQRHIQKNEYQNINQYFCLYRF